jgi:hypothetical protein
MPFNRPNPDSKPRSKISSGIDGLVQAEKLMQIAILLPSSAFIGWLGGALVDRLLHQRWIAIFGIVFGGISGLVYVVRLAIKTGSDTGDGTKTGNGTGKGSPDIEP